MTTENAAAGPSKAARWVGWIMGVLPALMMVMSAVMKFTMPPEAAEGFEHLGYKTSVAMPLGIVELGCTALYLIPQTSVLGAILLTGYLGGAIATHVRVGEAFLIPLILGIVFWGGLYLRDPRIRALIPLKR